MTISKGSPYGAPGSSLPAGAPICGDDASAAAAVAEARRAGSALPCVGLVGGDLCRTLGGPSGPTDREAAALAGAIARLEARAADAVTFPVDLVLVRLDGGAPIEALAHVVVRSRLWRRTWAVGNAAWLGGWNPWPRAHPGDGRLDLLDAGLGLADLWKVRARLPLGAHLPHPGISERRRPSHRLELPRPLPVRVDGVRRGRARLIEVDVVADAVAVTV